MKQLFRLLETRKLLVRIDYGCFISKRNKRKATSFNEFATKRLTFATTTGLFWNLHAKFQQKIRLGIKNDLNVGSNSENQNEKLI